MTTLFGIAPLSAVGINLSTTTLIVSAVLVLLFWPKIQQVIGQINAPQPTAVAIDALPLRMTLDETLQAKPSVATEFAALENLLAQRDTLHAEVTQALARAKGLIDKETAATATVKP